ncbi:MAG: hypothetical protein IJV15_05550 [Lachnospiraceae bacterium]|nr:hypothetical protein [Lachnospiraceae bacterium]
MSPLTVVLLVLIGIVICCIYPYTFETKYVDKFGGKGLSYILAGILGASVFWFSLVIEMPDSWQYTAAVVLFIVSAVLNLYWISKELRRHTVPISYKVQFAICQLLFSVGVFGVLFILLGALYLAGGVSRKKKK